MSHLYDFATSRDLTAVFGDEGRASQLCKMGLYCFHLDGILGRVE